MDKKQARRFDEILVLTQYYWPEPGAPQIRLRNLARELRHLGIKVRVLTGMPNYPLGRIFEAYRGQWHSREMVDDAAEREMKPL